MVSNDATTTVFQQVITKGHTLRLLLVIVVVELCVYCNKARIPLNLWTEDAFEAWLRGRIYWRRMGWRSTDLLGNHRCCIFLLDNWEELWGRIEVTTHIRIVCSPQHDVCHALCSQELVAHKIIVETLKQKLPILGSWSRLRSWSGDCCRNLRGLRWLLQGLLMLEVFLEATHDVE